ALLNRLERRDLAVGAPPRHAVRGAVVEALALVGAVDRDRVVAVIGSGAARGTRGRVAHLRGELELVDEVAAEGGNAAYQGIGDLGAHALASRGEIGRHTPYH